MSFDFEKLDTYKSVIESVVVSKQGNAGTETETGPETDPETGELNWELHP